MTTIVHMYNCDIGQLTILSGLNTIEHEIHVQYF